jgi:hypothetical protein
MAIKKTKKIGILTFHFADNYGAVLQVYALQTYLLSLGHEVKIIDYHPDYVTKGGGFHLPTNRRKIKADIVIAYLRIQRLYAWLFDRSEQKKLFSDFRRTFLSIDNGNYPDAKSIRENPPDYDAYICGSDQVWNPSVQYGVDPVYFLDFGSKKTRRISYAASFGKNTLDDEAKPRVASLLSRLDHISVREKSGIKIIKQLTGLTPHCLPDPTLLLDDYTSVTAEPEIREQYLMSYVLRCGDVVGDIQKYVADQLDLKIIVPNNPLKRWKDVGDVVYCGPREWLGYIKNARIVITNSFHGTVFSIIFKKPFITVGLTGKKEGLNERAISLLEMVGLKERLLDCYDESRIRYLIEAPIDWASVDSSLQTWRMQASEFFETALQ